MQGVDKYTPNTVKASGPLVENENNIEEGERGDDGQSNARRKAQSTTRSNSLGHSSGNFGTLGRRHAQQPALTRPLLALFGQRAFVKPQAGTSFPLAGLIGSDAVIWNDFRWPHPPLAWGDLLNMLDNEAFNIGVPKNDGQKDHSEFGNLQAPN